MPHDNDCKFYHDGNLTVFELPSPYFNDMWCKQNVTCSDPNQTVHYEFDYFETESGYDKLFVNDTLYEGYGVQTNEWIDSYSSKIDLVFQSDGSAVKDGFKMNLKCDLSSPEPPSDVQEVISAGSHGTCLFEDFGDSAIFDTGSPYQDNMRFGFTFSPYFIN